MFAWNAYFYMENRSHAQTWHISRKRASYRACESAKESSWAIVRAEYSISVVKNYRDSIMNEIMPRPSCGATLGFSQGIGEWAYDFKDIMDAAHKVDRYFSKECDSPRLPDKI
jgi:hypothetical protein